MHDQNSIDQSETPSQKYQRALDLFTESVLKPDHNLRGCAHNQGCYDQLMEIREHVLEYLKTLKEVTYHENADESDMIESEKMKYPWFAPKMQVFESGEVQDMCGEDVSFCLDAIEAGFEIWCDPLIRVGHEKTRVI